LREQSNQVSSEFKFDLNRNFVFALTRSRRTSRPRSDKKSRTQLKIALDENFPKFLLPSRVKTILLPFQDKIVYDGFLLPYQIIFGGGIKAELKEIYLKAKRKGKIITSL